jgi:hypothetical protein
MHCNTPAAPGRAAKISSFIHVQATFKGNPASSSKGDQAKKMGWKIRPRSFTRKGRIIASQMSRSNTDGALQSKEPQRWAGCVPESRPLLT